jgi:hypothetical protein
MRVTVADLIALPRTPCGCVEQQCPLLRTCPSCGFTFIAARNRRQHQNSCKAPLDVVVTEAQHEHVVAIHRIRPRRGRAKG